MNLYLRFFNEEVLVENADQAIEFLSSISEIQLDDSLRNELVKYAEGDNPYPKRFKVGSKVYFIVIKTTATTMEEFKAYAAESVPVPAVETEEEPMMEPVPVLRGKDGENPGWYLCTMRFKRVVAIEGTNKFQYVDTDFEAKLKATSIQDSYNRVVDHLRSRGDVDPRSQFPSIRGRNFKAEYLGVD